MADLVYVYHSNGKRLRVPSHRLDAVAKLGWYPKGQEPQDTEEEPEVEETEEPFTEIEPLYGVDYDPDSNEEM